MRSRNYSVLMIGLLTLGFLFVGHATPWGPTEAQAQGEPLIQFVSPPGTPRYLETANPIDPAIDIAVEVDFPAASTPCAGAPLPVDPASLAVTVNRLLDAAVLESWAVDTSTWTWNAENNNVTGQVTIGGEISGQGRSLYGIEVCINNSAALACATKGVRVEYPVAGFSAGAYDAKGTSFGQSGAGCNLIPSVAIPLINQQMANTEFLAIVPSGIIMAGGVGNTASFIGIPLIGSINMTANLNVPANDVDLAEVEVSGIDLSGIGFPGTNCVISGKADGSLLGEVSPGQDLDGSIRIYDIQLALGGGIGPCTLVAAPTCELNVKFDGNP